MSRPTFETDNRTDGGVVVAIITSAFGSVSSTFIFAGIMAFTIVAFVVVEVFAFSTTTFSVLAFCLYPWKSRRRCHRGTGGL